MIIQYPNWCINGKFISDTINTDFNIANNAIYGQFEFDFNIIRMNIGARYDSNTLEYKSGGIQYDPVNYFASNTPIEDDLSYADNQITQVYSFSQKIFGNFNHSIEFSKGYKPGGINQSIILEPQNRKYIKETNISAEYIANYNSSLISSKINLFYVYRDNPQVRLYYQFNPEIPTTFDFYTSNANNGYISGAELNFTIFLHEHLSISQDIGILKKLLRFK